LLVAVLSATAGASDVIAFLGLGGLFVAHITGNIVVLAVHYVTGGFGQIGPLLSVPVFILALALVSAFFEGKETQSALRVLLILHCALLSAFFLVCVAFGPFPNPDRPLAVFGGMLAVAGMATQSAMVKLDLPCLPSTAVLTTNIVELTIDVGRIIRGNARPDDLARARLTFPALAGFIAGCTAGAFLELHFRLWALILPVCTAAMAFLLGELWIKANARSKEGEWKQ
jgi:uncharacterized membrane protein YoaK (UPF0700 family)